MRSAETSSSRGQALIEPPGTEVTLSPHERREVGPKDYWATESWIAKTVELMSKPDMEAALFALHRAQSSLPAVPGQHAATYEAFTMAILNGKARTYLLLGNSELTKTYIGRASQKATRDIDLAVMLREATLYRSGEVAAKARLQKIYKSTPNPEHIHMLPVDVKAVATE